MSSRATKYPRELRERAVRMVLEHRDEYDSEWEAMRSIAGRLGIGTTESLRRWVRQAEVDGGARMGTTSPDRQRIGELEREVRELRRANEILKAASAFFARELDPRLPR
jgi:transposase